jgi:hypothetical protein
MHRTSSYAVRTVAGVVIAVVAVLAGAAYAADPPIGTIGVTSPDGTQTGTASAGSSGTADACVNGQHSGADPSASSSGAVTINDAACAASSSSQSTGGAGGSQASGSSGTAGAGGGAAAAGGGSAAGGAGSTASAWVSASGARGLRIARVQYLTRDVAVTKRFRVWVTLRDLNGRLVRHAIVSLSPVAAARHTIAGPAATYSNRQGQARLVLTATNAMLGRQLLLKIAARTPSVRAVTVGTVRLPRVAPR